MTGPGLDTRPLIGHATPYFVLDRNVLRLNVGRFRDAFSNVEVFYAVKANPEPAVLEALAEAGAGFEAASWQEIELLLQLGVDPGRVIFGTAVKPRDHWRVHSGPASIASRPIRGKRLPCWGRPRPVVVCSFGRLSMTRTASLR